MSDNLTTVDERDYIGLRIASMIRAKGLVVASIDGSAMESEIRHGHVMVGGLGVLTQDISRPAVTGMFGRVKTPARRKFLCVIWFDNPARDASEQNWYVEVFGGDQEDQAKALVTDLVRQIESKKPTNFIARLTARFERISVAVKVKEDARNEMLDADWKKIIAANS